MKVKINENGNKEQTGEHTLKVLPRNGEYIEYKERLYSIFKIVHSENGIKLLGIGVR